MSKIVSKAFENVEKPKWLVELKESLNSIDDIETALIQRYTLDDDGGINVKEQLFIFACIDEIRELTNNPRK